MQSATDHAVNSIVAAAANTDNLNLSAVDCREGAACHGRKTTSLGFGVACSDSRDQRDTFSLNERGGRQCVVANWSGVCEWQHGHCNTSRI